MSFLIDPAMPLVDEYSADAILRHVVVVCNGLPEGDSALHLCEQIARATAASVRAVAWLPERFTDVTGRGRPATIEHWLDAITQQLYRVTQLPGLWRLTLIVGNRWRELTRVCDEERTDLIIMPETECNGEGGTSLTTTTGIPVACAAPAASGVLPSVLLTAGVSPHTQHAARRAAAVIAAVHRNAASSTCGYGRSFAPPVA